MIISSRVILILTIWASVSLDTLAFDINPCLRKLTYADDGSLGQTKVRWFNVCPVACGKLKHVAVHEHMTVFSINAYRDETKSTQDGSKQKIGKRSFVYVEGAALKPWSKNQRIWQGAALKPWKNQRIWQGATLKPWKNQRIWHRTDAIVYGSWWNDDPLMYWWGQGNDIIMGGEKFAQVFGKNVRGFYSGDPKNCKNKIPPAEFLPRLSHFGRLQHLHFMTDIIDKCKPADMTNLERCTLAGDRLGDTITKVMDWMKFAYGVAVGGLLPESQLTRDQESELGLPSIAANLCIKPENTKIRSLFARTGLKTEDRNNRTPDIALGSMFHIIQDSFSPAHTCRIEKTVNGETYAVLHDVYNYREQDETDHRKKDAIPDWLIHYAKDTQHVYVNDPIAVGAWLLDAVDQRKEWGEVEAHLKDTVFARSTTESNGQTKCIGKE